MAPLRRAPVVPDLSRRTILAGLLAAPVAVPAAAAAANPWPVGGAVFSGNEFDVFDFEWAPLASRPEGWTPMPEFHIGEPPVEGETRRILQWAAGDPSFREWRERFTNGQWIKEEDTTAEGDIGPEAGMPDVLDRDAEAFCAVAWSLRISLVAEGAHRPRGRQHQ